MRTPEDVARDIEGAREEVRSAWMHYNERDAAERSAVEGVIAAYRDEVRADVAASAGEATPGRQSGERDVRVALHVTEKVSHVIEATVPEGFLEDMRQDDVDTRDVQAVTTWLAGNLDTDDALIVDGIGDAVEFAVTERSLDGVSPLRYLSSAAG